ncbi:MAG TPA: hypothetical protein VEL47_06385 [Myxococcota bacterium]|nr:hypothetical protein [Myxococcota bacterium]
MDVSKIILGAKPIRPEAMHSQAGAFKAVLEEKRAKLSAVKEKLPLPSPEKTTSTWQNAVNEMIDNHEMATKSVKTFMTRTDYTPEKLLAIQYKTGLLFLREQMFSKTAELCANTFKNFTQMQV